MTTERTEAERDRDWICQLCGQRYVVPVLARDCEAKHMEDPDG